MRRYNEGADSVQRGAPVSVYDLPDSSQQVTSVNGVPIMQVGPVLVEAGEDFEEQSQVNQVLVPQQPAYVNQPVIGQPDFSRMQPMGTSTGSRMTSVILTALTIAAVLLTCHVMMTTCSAVFDNDGPSYDHTPLGGGSNGMDGAGDSTGYGLIPFDFDMPEPTSDPDDGELHEYWDDSVSYTVRGESLTRNQESDDNAYGCHVTYDFSIAYPQLEGDLEHLDQINALIRNSAMRYYTRLYESPDEDMVGIVETVLDGGKNALIGDEATYAISYNSDRLISIMWSHDILYGSTFAEYLYLETLNIDLETGEAYTLEDVLEVSEPMARAWVDNYGRFEYGEDAIEMFGREAMVQGILGEGDFANRTQAVVFVDSDGTPNLGVSFWFGNDRGISRGWWDLTLTEELLEGSRKDSPFWELVPAVEEEAPTSEEDAPPIEEAAPDEGKLSKG